MIAVVTFIFTGPVPALQDIWMVGDSFVKKNSWDSLVGLNMKAKIDKMPKPYIFEYFNIIPCYPSQGTSFTKSAMARMLNEVVTKLNANPKWPKYIVLVLDKDLVEDFHTRHDEVDIVFQKALMLLGKNIDTAVDLCIEDLRGRRMGALGHSEDPKVIWVKMMARLFIKGENAFIFRQTHKFNEALRSCVLCFSQGHVWDIRIHENVDQLFDFTGNFTPYGKIVFWRNQQNLQEL